MFKVADDVGGNREPNAHLEREGEGEGVLREGEGVLREGGRVRGC